MKKKIIQKLITILVIIICGVGIVHVNNNYYAIWNSNKIHVWTGKSYDPHLVKIQFGISAFTMTEENDLQLFDKNNRFQTIFESGENKAKINNEYGENDFLLTYDNKYYLTFRHFKVNCNPQHTYLFSFYWNNDGLYASVKIKGEFPMELKHRMIPIESAADYHYSVLKDSLSETYHI